MIINILSLGHKEIKSLLSDIPLIIMIVTVFTFVVVTVFEQVRAEVKNATVAIIDEDQSPLSRTMTGSLTRPYFKTPIIIQAKEIVPDMNKGKYIFVISIPKDFQAEISNLGERKIQLLVDATAMTQAGIGSAYIHTIFMQELLSFVHLGELASLLPTEDNTTIYFNANNDSGRYSAIMQLVMNITLLSLVLAGTAVIREKERGTIEHLLVMPVSVFEIVCAKIVANGIVVLVATMLSLLFVAHLWLGIPINGSIFLLLICCSSYIFAIASLGVLLATILPSMPQFGLMITPIIMISHLTSGGASPVEAMSPNVQTIVKFSPTTHFVYNMQDIIFRGTTFNSIAFSFFVILLYGLIFFTFAIIRFKVMLQKFN